MSQEGTKKEKKAQSKKRNVAGPAKAGKAGGVKQVQITFPKKAASKGLPSVLTLQPDVKPEAISGFINRLLFDKDFRDEYAKDPVSYMRELGIKVEPTAVGELVKIDISDQFMRLRPDLEEPQAAAAVVAAIVVIGVFAPPKPAH